MPTHNEPLNDDRPCLFIPAWPPPTLLPSIPDDTGARPLPFGLHPESAAGIAVLTPYQPGAPLTVTVEIGNSGGGSATSLAFVSVWWMTPDAVDAASPPAEGNLIGAAVVPVAPRGGRATTEQLTKLIPATAPPDMIALIARVHHPSDLPQNPRPDPIKDRHWGRRDISAGLAP